MRFLVTGGAGFIGSHLTERLLAQGHSVRVLDNLSTGKTSNLPEGAPGLEFVEGDIGDNDTVVRCMDRVDGVAHLAAVASVQASIDDPVATHRSNFDGTLNLLEAARKQGTQRFIYACSAAIYGDTEQLPVSEGITLKPMSPYAIDKLAGEYYMTHYHNKYGLNTTSFRFFNIYGPRQDPSSPYSGVISIFTDRLGAGQGVTLFGDGEQTRDFVYVGDLVALLGESLERDDMAGEVTNVGTGKQCSLLDILDALERISGKSIPRKHEAPRLGDIRHSLADVRHLHQLFGRVPETGIEAGLVQLLAAQ